MNQFHTKEFFSYDGFLYKELLEGAQYPWELLFHLKDYLANCSLGKIEGVVEKGATIVNPELVSIGKGTVVESGAYIKGPFVIGENGSVRHSAYIRGNVLAGNSVVIGHATETKNSIFLNGAQAGHFAYIGDSVLGNNVNLGAGTKCANLRFDDQNVHIMIEGNKIDTGLRKLGAIIGDRAQIGCNAVTNPGTLIFPDSFWYPCVNHGGVVPKSGRVKQGGSVRVLGGSV